MRIVIAAIGRLGRTPEAGLARDWAERATATGRALGLGPVEILELDPKKTGKAPEADALLEAAGKDAVIVACDEHGEALTSRAFAERVAKLRDEGARRLVLMIGGADGHGEAVLKAARFKLAMGPQTWPHALARAMLAEQVYRATTILAGTPYHRD